MKSNIFFSSHKTYFLGTFLTHLATTVDWIILGLALILLAVGTEVILFYPPFLPSRVIDKPIENRYKHITTMLLKMDKMVK